jgi:DUF1009 family protein
MSDRAVTTVVPATDNKEPLAIVCGGGRLPLRIADAVAERGRPVFLLAIHGAAEREIERHPHAWIKLGEARLPLRLLAQNGCREVCIIGNLTRPPLGALKFDRVSLRLATRLARLWLGGDDRLLSGIARILEGEFGLKIVSAQDVVPEILAPEGSLTRRQPTGSDFSDMDKGFALLRALGPHDVGQTVVVAEGRVLAVEAAEGTDAMIERVGELRRQDGPPRGGGVLVKGPKPAQDRRLDLPTIGPRTVEGAARAGLAGIAVAAGATILAEREVMVSAADRANLFIFGVAEGAPKNA